MNLGQRLEVEGRKFSLVVQACGSSAKGETYNVWHEERTTLTSLQWKYVTEAERSIPTVRYITGGRDDFGQPTVEKFARRPPADAELNTWYDWLIEHNIPKPEEVKVRKGYREYQGPWRRIRVKDTNVVMGSAAIIEQCDKERLNLLTEIAQRLEQHPQWRNGPRRVRTSKKYQLGEQVCIQTKVPSKCHDYYFICSYDGRTMPGALCLRVHKATGEMRAIRASWLSKYGEY